MKQHDNSEAMRLADWHDEQAHGWWRAAEHKAVDRAEPVKSSLLRKATFHKDSAALIRKQAERIAELEARVHTCGPTCSKAGCINRRVTAERDQLRAEVERYHHLRNGQGWPAVFASHDAPEPIRGDELDTAIDAARTHKETE